MKDLRVGDLAFNQADRSLWGIRHLNGICTLVKLAPPYTEWTRVHSWPYGTIVYDLDVSPDGTRVSASFGEVTGQQDVRVFETQQLLAGNVEPVARFDFGQSVPSGFVFAPDGKTLVGSSYLTGVSNIFSYDFATKQTAALSNTETGFFRPVPRPEDSDLFVFRYSGEGFVASRIQPRPLDDISPITFFGERLVNEHPVLKSWLLGSPADVNVAEKQLVEGKYKLAGGLQRESIYPIVQGYKDSAAIGLRANFSDPLQLNRLNLSASFSAFSGIESDERVHLRAEYQRFDWRARATYNDADFYDLFGPTKTSRKGYSVGLGYRRTLLYDEPRRIELETDTMFAGDLDRLPHYQNVVVEVDKMFAYEAVLKGQYIRSSLGRVDDEKGTKWSVSLDGSRAAGAWNTRWQGSFDAGLPLSLPHSSIWLRTAAGVSPGAREDPFANFFFGGFGNNYVDHRDEKRYRMPWAFPGLELNELGGRSYLRSMLELNLPPWRFRRIGTPGFYATWMRPALFASVLTTEPGSGDFQRVVTNAGAQVDFQLSALSALDMVLSFGGAVAFEDGFSPRREFMASFKILR